MQRRSSNLSLEELLDAYSRASRLLGHGVTYSMFSAGGEARAIAWGEALRRECRSRPYHHIAEHFVRQFDDRMLLVALGAGARMVPTLSGGAASYEVGPRMSTLA